MLAAMLPHSSVGQVANMPAADAGRINFKAISVVMLVNDVLHDSMGSRRAADVAEADEKQFDSVLGCKGFQHNVDKYNENTCSRKMHRDHPVPGGMKTDAKVPLFILTVADRKSKAGFGPTSR